MPIGPAAESALTEEQYFKKYGAKVEFKAFFYFANSWDVGSFDGTYTVGVFCHNSSSKIDVWVESESLAINTHCPASTSNLFLGELSNEDADFESTSLISTSILDKYGGVYRTGGAYHPSNLVGGSASLAGKTAIYSTEVAPNNVPTGVTTPADLPALSPGGTYTDGIIINYSDKKLLTKEHDVKLLVFTFSVYIAPINGFELANAEGGAVFAPGSVEADELLADGLVDVQIEFCEPLWDEVEEEYKYLSRYESADHRQFDGIYRIYSAMMYPHYLKKAG